MSPKQLILRRGPWYDRTADHPLEAAFSAEWEARNEPQPGINYGHGVLQDIFFRQTNGMMYCLHEVDEPEQMVAHSLIQWLGTNCGVAFLEAAFRRGGYHMRLTQIPTDEPDISGKAVPALCRDTARHR